MTHFKDFLINNNIDFKENFSLKEITFTKTGGSVEFFCLPKNIEELVLLKKQINLLGLKSMVVGNASNLIISDNFLNGVIINLKNLDYIKMIENKLYAGSGALLSDVSKFAQNNSFSGLEFSCGIPGSVGGAVCMNAGAYGGEMKDVITKVLVMTEEGEVISLDSSEMNFVYRNSIVKERNLTVLEIECTLEKDSSNEINNKIENYTYLRETKQPLEYPSCGSVFKRPTGYFAGKLIQDAGLQGRRVGGVEVSTKHAGFMVNVDSGSATDYIDLINHVQNVVQEKFNVTLETEVKVITEI